MDIVEDACCKTCKHSFVMGGVVDGESKGWIYICKLNNETVKDEDKCLCYVKRSSPMMN